MKCDGAKVREEAADIKRSKTEARKDLDTKKLNALNVHTSTPTLQRKSKTIK